MGDPRPGGDQPEGGRGRPRFPLLLRDAPEDRWDVDARGPAHGGLGESWFDHEWASNQLTAQQAGWNWLSVQFDDGTELMLYEMRLRDGGIDTSSSGTFIGARGETRHLAREDYELKPLRFWTSPKSGARYPIAFQVTIPTLAMATEISTPLPEQELALSSFAYWEGLIDAQGTRADSALHGHGYLELTGYARPLSGLMKGE